jgi:hypothetical protein
MTDTWQALRGGAVAANRIIAAHPDVVAHTATAAAALHHE